MLFGELRPVGATTDLITNTTTFPKVDLEREILDIFRLGPSPSHHLASFIHEATHQWCFHSPVATALATLAFEARRHGLLLISGELKEHEKDPHLGAMVDRQLRFNTAVQCLEPFMEGIACFAEFDATPRLTTRVRSEPMNSVAWFFGMPVPGESHEGTIIYGGEPPSADIPDFQVQVDQWLLRALGKLRSSADLVDRKSNLLVQPLSTGSRGYLLGYLFVKTLWDGLARRAPRLRNETDLALTYLRNFIFEDWTLVDLLLDDQTWSVDDSVQRPNYGDTLLFTHIFICRISPCVTWWAIPGTVILGSLAMVR